MTTVPEAPHHVAVYGTLRPGASAWSLWAASADYVGGAMLPGWELRDNGPFPFAIRSSEPTAMIRVDVLRVDSDLLAMFDRYEGYPRLYKRVRVPVRVPAAAGPDRPYGLLSAWIYTPSSEVVADLNVLALPVVGSGDWLVR